MAGAATTAVLNFVVVLAVTRGFDKDAAGVVFTATAVFVLVESICRLGTDLGIVHFVSTARARRESEEVAAVLWASLIPVVIAAILGAVVTALLAPILMRTLGTAADTRHAQAIVDIVAVGIPIAAVYDTLTAATRGLGSARPTVLVERTLRPLLQGVGVLAAAVLGASSQVVVFAWVAPYLVVTPIMIGWLTRLLRRDALPVYSPSWQRVFPSVWRFTLPRAFTGVIQIMLQRLDIILVGAILGAPAAAVYTGATRFVVVGQLGNQAMAYAFQPQLARLVATRQLDDARQLYRSSSAWIAGLTAPLYVSVCVTSPWLIRLLGHQYQSGMTTMIIVTGAMLVGNACGLVDLVLVTMGRTSWNLANAAAALTLNVAIDLLLIPRIGISGAAIGWAVAIVCNNIVPVLQIHHAYGFNPLSSRWFKLLGAVAALFGAIPGLALLASHDNSVVVGAALILGAGSYVGLIWHWREDLGVSEIFQRRRGSVAGSGVGGSVRPEVAVGAQLPERGHDG